MILTCPNCSTQYAVKDGAIPPQGRQVRCAACKHSWQEFPREIVSGEAAPESPAAEPEWPVAETPAAEPHAEPAEHDAPERSFGEVDTNVPESPAERAAEAEEPLAEATLIEPRSGPEAEALAYQAAQAADAAPSRSPEPVEPAVSETAGWREDNPSPQDDFSPFVVADDEPAERRSRPLLTLLLVVLAIVVIAVLFYYLAPESLKSRLGMAQTGVSPLALVMTHMDRQRLESGNELLTVTGRVINPTASEQPVPPLQAQLKSKSGQVVYRWTIAPPAQSLPPGASAPFNSAEVNVPPGGEDITLTLGSPAR